MSKFQIVKGIIDNLEETPYTEGKVYFTYDNVESQNITIYADIDGVRRKIKEGVQRDELNNYLLKTDIANWAKASAKPTYTASEVGALSTSHPAANITTEQITQWNNKSNFSGSYNDLTEKPPIPTRTSDLTNDSNYVENTYVADLDNPSANMYNEIIAAYNAGRNIIGEYQNKVILLPFIGIGESSVQFGLEVNQQSFLLTLNSDGTLDTNNNNFTIPTKTSDLTNDSGFLTEETDPTVPAWAKTANKPTYTAEEVGAVPFNASQAMATLKGNPSTLRFASTNTANQYVQAYVDTNSASITLQSRYNSGYPIVSNVKLKGIASPQDSKDAANKDYVDSAVSDKMTSTEVNSAIATAIGNINQFNVAIVSTLPTENIDNHTIYFMSNGGSNDDIYNEWMYINDNWEKIGATSIDLSGYMQTSHPANGITSADITNWNSKSDTDELVKQEYNNSSSNYPVLLSPQYQDTTITSSVYKNTNVYVSPREGFLHADKLQVGTVAQSGYISLGKNRFYGTNNGTDSYTITLPTASGTVALTSDIPTVPTKISDLTNDSGFISSYTETDPVFSASVAANITSTDISNWNSKTSNTGTVTSIGLTNATDSGLTISGSPITNSGNITVGHSNILSSAQTTQAVYPIKIDKNGHISAYGSAVTITDEKVKQTPLNSENSIRGLLFSSSPGNSEVTNSVSTSDKIQWNDYNQRLAIYNSDKTKHSYLTDTILSLANNDNSYNGKLQVANLTANRSYSLPDKGGTIALTSDIPNITSTDISNWNAKSNTDEKVKTEEYSTADSTGHPIVLGKTSAASITESKYATTNLTFYINDSNYYTLKVGSEGRAKGRIWINSGDGNTNNGTYLITSAKSNRIVTLPDKAGTVALTSDIPDTSSFVSNITYDATNRELKQTINGTTSTIVDFGTAAFKLVTTTISSNSSNLPTAEAVIEYVDSKIPKVYSSTNTTGYLTMDTLPIYNGTVV